MGSNIYETLICLAFLIAPAVVGTILEAKAKGSEQGEYCLLFVPGLGHFILFAVLSLAVLSSPIVFVDWLINRKEVGRG